MRSWRTGFRNGCLTKTNDDMETIKTVEYWRQPTDWEIRFGEGAIHWLTVNVDDVRKPDGSLKRWFVNKADGLRYYRGR